MFVSLAHIHLQTQVLCTVTYITNICLLLFFPFTLSISKKMMFLLFSVIEPICLTCLPKTNIKRQKPQLTIWL